MRAQDDRVVARQLLDQATSLDDLLGVETGGRLVEDQHLGVVNQRLRQTHALPVALRQLAARTTSHVADPGSRHHLFDPRRALPRRDALDLGDEVQVFADRHVRVEWRRLGQIAGPPLGFDGLSRTRRSRRRRRVPRSPGCSRSAPASSSSCRRRWAEKAQDFAFLDLKADVVHSDDVAVPLREVFDLDHRMAPLFWRCAVCVSCRPGAACSRQLPILNERFPTRQVAGCPRAAAGQPILARNSRAQDRST